MIKIILGNKIVPIMIASKGRAGNSSTLELLDGHPVILFVEPQDEEAYLKAYPKAQVLILSQNDKGISFARRACLLHARSTKLKKFWMLDDDINGSFIVSNGKCKRAPFPLVLAGAQQELDKQDLAIGALEYQQYAWASKKDFAFNSYCDVAVLIDVEKTRQINYRDGVKEDRDFVLQALSWGFRTARITKFAFSAPKNGSNKGGLHEAYKAGLEAAWSKKMVELWPGVCSLQTKNDGRPDVKISWKLFRGPFAGQ